ncbi:MAG: hypothetical protein ACR2K3_09095 [Nocardioides sp.]
MPPSRRRPRGRRLPEAQLQDAVTRYADALTLAASKVRADLDDAPSGPLPWLAGVPDGLVAHPAWGPYLTARARRVGTLTDKVRTQTTSTLPEWTHRYDDILTPELGGDLSIWRAVTGVKRDDRSLAGPVPDNDREAAYPAVWSERSTPATATLKVWETRIVDYVGRRDEHTTALAKRLDELQRHGIDAEQMLDLAAARKPLPADHPTSALAYRIRELASPRKRKLQAITPFPRAHQQGSGPSLGL